MASLYLDESLPPEAFRVGGRIEVGGADARHAAQVARARRGERVSVGDGRGRIAHGVIVEVGAGALVVEADRVEQTSEAEPRLWLAQALAKGGRDELAVQAATELGVAGVIPWSAARSVSRWDAAKAEKGRARWATIAREAAKQSIRSTVPQIAPLTDARGLAGMPGLVLVLDPTASARLSDPTVLAAAESSLQVVLVVGPEGGLAESELDLLEAGGAVRVRLGDEVLRTSTAGPAALAALLVLLRRW